MLIVLLYDLIVGVSARDVLEPVGSCGKSGTHDIMIGIGTSCLFFLVFSLMRCFGVYSGR